MRDSDRVRDDPARDRGEARRLPGTVLNDLRAAESELSGELDVLAAWYSPPCRGRGDAVASSYC
jgi:hypothetical protein